MLTLVIGSLSWVIIAAVFIWLWHQSIKRAAELRPQIFIFSWNGKQVEVAADHLTEWLALRQLTGDDWPPMVDLLRAREMIQLPTTETDLKREVWSNLDRVRRAYKRGREALERGEESAAEPGDGSRLDS